MTALKNLEDLRKLREKVKDDLNERFGGEIKIIVGMGTCGIAAGARAAAIPCELRPAILTRQ